MGYILDITNNKIHISKYRGFLELRVPESKPKRIAIDQISAVIMHAYGASYSNNAITAMSKNHIPLVICAPNHRPMSYLLSVEGHHAQAGIMRVQSSASLPLNKQLWKSIVISKITTQASLLYYLTGTYDKLPRLAGNIKSGDSTNNEAEAARVYWPKIMGNKFKRDYQANDMNSALNYGYTILRAAIARYIMAAGLHPSLGIFHKNIHNNFALADDLIEPYRPFIDHIVHQYKPDSLTPEIKSRLVNVLTMDITHNSEITSIENSIKRLCISLAKSYREKRNVLSLPDKPKSEIWMAHYETHQ